MESDVLDRNPVFLVINCVNLGISLNFLVIRFLIYNREIVIHTLKGQHEDQINLVYVKYYNTDQHTISIQTCISYYYFNQFRGKYAPWTARRSNQSILKEISPEYSLEGLMLKLQYFGHLIQGANSLEKTLMLGKIEGGRRRG